MPWTDVSQRVLALLPELREVRHDIHKHPELGFEERRTQEVVMTRLRELGYAPRVCAETGVLADLHEGDTPSVALRCDLDALPIHETTDLPYRSVHDGVAHKCGHDGHTTIMLGVAATLAAMQDQLPGNVRLLFQPAEEGARGGGARVMVEEGALDGVREVYGLHNWPGFPKGAVRVQPGPVMAQVDSFYLTLTGVGGHGSQPDRCRDPIVAGAQVVTAIQTVVSRGIGALDSGVVSVGSFRAGDADNVIPGEARMTGTIRSLGGATRDRIFARLREVVEGVAVGMGVQADLVIKAHYPVLVNDDACAATVLRVAERLFPEAENGAAGLPLLASEDFAFFTEKIAGAYFFLGAGVPDAATPGCHHPDFDFDDDLIERGIRMFLGILEDRLADIS